MISDSEVETELQYYIDTLVDPIFAEHLKDLLFDYPNRKSIVSLDLVDITSSLSNPGKSWVENVAWDITKQLPNIFKIIATIKSAGFDISTTQRILIWFKLGANVSLSEIDLFNEQLSLLGNDNTEFLYDFELKKDSHNILLSTVLISGLTESTTTTHGFMNTVVRKSIADFITHINHEDVRNFYFEAIYNSFIEPEKKISAIKDFIHNNKNELLNKTLELNKVRANLESNIPLNCIAYKKVEKDRILEWKKVLAVLKNERFPFYEDLPK